MTDDTQTFTKPENKVFEDGKTSHFMGLSLRGLIALIVVLNACIMGVLQIKEPDSLAYLTALVVGHYFGQVNKQNTSGAASVSSTLPPPKV